MNKNILLIGLCFCIVSCVSHKQEENIHTIKFDSPDFKNWSSLITIDSVIPLELNDTSLLSIATKCLISTNRILFWDYKTKQVYAYGRNGKFLFTVGKQGGAESEYIELRDVIFSKDNSRIEFLDPTGILIYNADNGQFIEKKKIKDLDLASCFRFMHCPDDSYVFFTPSGEYSISKVANGNVEGLRKNVGYQLICNRFYPTAEGCLVIPDYGKFIIDLLKEGKLEAKYQIELGNKSLPEDMLPETFQQFQKIDGQDEYFKSVVDLMESEELLYMRLVGPSRTYYDIYWNKKTGENFVGPADMDMGLVLVAVDGEHLYGLVYPDYLSEKSSLYPMLKQYILEEESNPLFVKLRLNEK